MIIYKFDLHILNFLCHTIIFFIRNYIFIDLKKTQFKTIGLLVFFGALTRRKIPFLFKSQNPAQTKRIYLCVDTNFFTFFNPK